MASPVAGVQSGWEVCRWWRGFTAWLLRSTSSLVRFARFDCAWQPHSLPSLPLCGKYEVSIIFPLLFLVWQCLVVAAYTGFSWLPYMLGSCACGSNIFPGTFPKLIYCWWVEIDNNNHTIEYYFYLYSHVIILSMWFCIVSLSMKQDSVLLIR